MTTAQDTTNLQDAANRSVFHHNNYGPKVTFWDPFGTRSEADRMLSTRCNPKQKPDYAMSELDREYEAATFTAILTGR